MVVGGIEWASALAGYEAVNWGKKVLHDGSTLHDRDAFIYGGALTLDVECYVAVSYTHLSSCWVLRAAASLSS